MTNDTITRSEAIDRMRDGLPCETLIRMSEPDVPVMKPTQYAGYFAGEDGHIWSTRRCRQPSGRKLGAAFNASGYLIVSVRVNDKFMSKRVHCLMCEAWHGPKPSEQHQVRHLDGDKINNTPSNLAWGTAKDNAEDRTRHGRCAGRQTGLANLGRGPGVSNFCSRGHKRLKNSYCPVCRKKADEQRRTFRALSAIVESGL